MKKTLIKANNLDSFVQADGKSLCLGPGHILTPGAKDAARNRGLTITYSNQDLPAEEASKQPQGPDTADNRNLPDFLGDENTREEIRQTVVRLLQTEFHITKNSQIRDITMAVLALMKTRK